MENTPPSHALRLTDRLLQLSQKLSTSASSVEDEIIPVLDDAPGQANALMLFVSGLVAAGNSDRAVAVLQGLAEAQPNLASVHNELGLLLANQGEAETAAKAFQRVVDLESQHPTAWRALGDQLTKIGAREKASQAYNKQFEISLGELKLLEGPSEPPVDYLDTAEVMLTEFLKIHPTDVSARWMSANLAARLGRHDRAKELLEEILKITPSFSLARHMFAWLLSGLAEEEQALAELDILLKEEPDKVEYLYMRAMSLLNLSEFDRALKAFEILIEKHPKAPLAWSGYGYTLKTMGRRDEAVDALKKSLELDPGHGEAWWNLASLRTFRFSPSDIREMRRALERKDLSEDSRIQLHHALGKAMEDEKTYSTSFRQYALGNELRGKKHAYDPQSTTRAFARTKAVFTKDFFRARETVGIDTRDPIFVLGMTRSGSTLVEQILSSHSLIEGTKELRAVHGIAQQVGENDKSLENIYPEIVADVPPEEFKRLGEEYMKRAARHRKTQLPYFIDKTPGNFQMLGFIHLILPNAKIIDVRRHPLGCGFANFRLYFQAGQPFTSDLEHIGLYYRDYVDLMTHFDEVLPGRAHRIFYEDLVSDPEKQVRAVLEYCGLPFEEQCLRFYETERAVLTPSSEQVRQPIFSEGMDQWRHYDPWLGPMKQALGDVLTNYPQPSSVRR